MSERFRSTTNMRTFGVALVRECVATLSRSQCVERGVHRDAIEPGEKIGPTIERREALVRPHERLLRDVIGVAVVAEDMKGGGVHASLMAPDEATESFSISLACPGEVWILVSHVRGHYKGTGDRTTGLIRGLGLP